MITALFHGILQCPTVSEECISHTLNHADGKIKTIGFGGLRDIKQSTTIGVIMKHKRND